MNIDDELIHANPKLAALAKHLDCEPDDIDEMEYDHYGLTLFEVFGGGTYAVGDEASAEMAWDQSLDSYIEDCIQPEIDRVVEGLGGNLACYIKLDEESWKRDARTDGRGHSLNSYDGSEDEVEVGGVTYYIYRTN